MECLALIAVLVVIASPILLFAILSQIGAVKEDVRIIKTTLQAAGERTKRRRTAATGSESDASTQVLPPAEPERREPDSPTGVAEPPTPSPRTTRPAPVSELPPRRPVLPPAVNVAAATPASDVPVQRESPRSPPKGKSASQSQDELESLIGKTWMVRIGAVVLVLGLGFLYQWSVEHGYITPAHRVLTGTIAGLALWGLGLRHQRVGYTALSQGFLGGGSAVLYLTAFAADSMFGLIPDAASFSAMVAITAITVFFALRASAMPLAVLAQIGGYLAPVLVGQPETSPHVLYGYLFVLNSGLLFAATSRGWTLVERLSWAGTALLFAARYLDGVTPWTAFAWATTFAAQFHLFLIVPNWRHRRPFAMHQLVPLATNAATWLLVCWRSLGRDEILGLTVLAVGLTHLALGYRWRRRCAQDKNGSDVITTTGGLLIFACIPLMLDANFLTIGWAVQGAALVVIAARNQHRSTGVAGVVALAAAALRILTVHLPWAPHTGFLGPFPERGMLFLNPDFLTSLCVMGAVTVAAWPSRGLRGPLLLVTLFGTIATTAIEAGVGLARVHGVGPTTTALAGIMWSVHFAVALLACVAIANRARYAPALATALPVALAAVTLIGVNMHVLQDVPGLLFLNTRFIFTLTVPILFAVSALAVRGTTCVDKDEERRIRRGLTIAALGMSFLLLSVEVAGYFGRLANSQVVQAALSVTWTAYAAILLVAGIIVRRSPIRLAGLIMLGLTLCKVTIIDLAELQEVYRIVSFIALGLVLMGGAWLYHRFDSRMFGDSLRRLTKDSEDAKSSA